MRSILTLGAFAIVCCTGMAQAFVLEAGCPPNATCATVDGDVIGSGDSAVVYLAINNAGPAGVDLGGKIVGNGSHLLDAKGDYMMDCTANEAACRAALEAAKDGASSGGGGGQTAEPAKPEEPATPPADDGRQSDAETQVHADSSGIYFIGGARLYFRDGRLIFQSGR